MKDRMKGKAREVKGRMTGDVSEQVKGKAQQAAGEAKQNIEAATRKRKHDDNDDDHDRNR